MGWSLYQWPELIQSKLLGELENRDHNSSVFLYRFSCVWRNGILTVLIYRFIRLNGVVPSELKRWIQRWIFNQFPLRIFRFNNSVQWLIFHPKQSAIFCSTQPHSEIFVFIKNPALDIGSNWKPLIKFKVHRKFFTHRIQAISHNPSFLSTFWKLAKTRFRTYKIPMK